MHAGNPRAAYKDIILFRSVSVGWRKYSSLNRLTISFENIFMHCKADESEVPISGSALSAHVPLANVKICGGHVLQRSEPRPARSFCFSDEEMGL
jgi:hypothetical protein